MTSVDVNYDEGKEDEEEEEEEEEEEKDCQHDVFGTIFIANSVP